MAIAGKVPRIASIVAFVLAGVTLVIAVIGPIIALPLALIPLMAGIGIMRKSVWSAYGCGLYFLAQLFPAAIIFFRRETTARPPELIASAVWMIVLGGLFLFAGRSLASAGAPRGRALPWILVAIICNLPWLFIQPFVIPTGAMEDTILIGDRIFVLRFPKPSVARGDLVVFFYPIDRKQIFVKRVIGVPGDRIRISKKAVYRNGTMLTEPWVVHKTNYEDAYRDNFPSQPDVNLRAPAQEMLAKHVVNGEVVVPEGSYFVLGDNRDSSLDSRYWGFVGVGDMIGKPLLIYDSREESTEEATNPNIFHRGRTRWSRLFKLL